MTAEDDKDFHETDWYEGMTQKHFDLAMLKTEKKAIAKTVKMAVDILEELYEKHLDPSPDLIISEIEQLTPERVMGEK